MAEIEGYVLTEQAIRQLRADHNELRGQIKNWKASIRQYAKPEQKIDGYRFLNDSAEKIPAYAVMRITGGKVGYETYFTCDKPNSTLQSVYLVNGGAEVEKGSLGWAQKFDETQYVLWEKGVTDAYPSYGNRWGPTSGSWKISKSGFGFLVLSFDSATQQIAAMQKRFPVIGKTDAAIAKSASGTVSVYSGSTGGTDTGINVTAYNAFASVGSGKYVWVDHNGDGWFLTAAECA